MSTAGRGGVLSMHCSPLAPELPSSGVKPLLFKRKLWGFSFDVVWGHRAVHAGECRGQGGARVRVSVCMRCSARDIVGVHQSKGLWARRSAAPDSALQEGLVGLQGRLRVLHSLGQKPWPSWKMWIQWLLCPKPRDMPSEKSDLCRKSECVFEPLLLSLAVWGKKWENE